MMNLLTRFFLLALVAFAVPLVNSALAQNEPATKEPNQRIGPQNKVGLDLFKRDVHQILVGRCIRCHGGKTTESELDLTNRTGLLKGGSSGAAIVPANTFKAFSIN